MRSLHLRLLHSRLSRRPARVARKAQKGLTLLEIMIVIAILGLLVVIVVPRVMDALGESNVKLSKVLVDKIANEEFPRWTLKNTDKTCADATVVDIRRAVDKKVTEDDAKDTWGKPLKIACDDASFKGIYSFGENGKDDNGDGDDIKSWAKLK